MLERAVQPAQVEALSGTVMQGRERRWASNLPASSTFPPPAARTVTALGFSSHHLEILLTAVELKLSLKGLKPLGQEIRHQTLSLIRSGSTATQHKRT